MPSHIRITNDKQPTKKQTLEDSELSGSHVLWSFVS